MNKWNLPGWVVDGTKCKCSKCGYTYHTKVVFYDRCPSCESTMGYLMHCDLVNDLESEYDIIEKEIKGLNSNETLSSSGKGSREA